MSDRPLAQKSQNSAEQDRPHNDASRLHNASSAGCRVHFINRLNRTMVRLQNVMLLESPSKERFTLPGGLPRAARLHPPAVSSRRTSQWCDGGPRGTRSEVSNQEGSLLANCLRRGLAARLASPDAVGFLAFVQRYGEFRAPRQ